MKNLPEKRVAIVTGADRGIGHAICTHLLNKDINTVLISNNSSGLQDVQIDSKKQLTVAIDVRDSKAIDKSIQMVMEKFGRIDYLINVAGVAYYGGVEMCTEDQWDETMGVNVKGYFLMTKAVFPHMKKQKSGMIINMSSIWGTRGSPTMLAYSASKFAVEGLTKSLLEEGRSHGIKVASVILDKVDTPFRDEMCEYVNFDDEQKIRMLSANDVADTVGWMMETSNRSLPSSITLDAFLWK